MSLSFSLSIVQSGRALNVYVYGYTSRNRSDPGDHTHIECVCIDPRYMYIFPDNHTTVDVYISSISKCVGDMDGYVIEHPMNSFFIRPSGLDCRRSDPVDSLDEPTSRRRAAATRNQTFVSSPGSASHDTSRTSLRPSSISKPRGPSFSAVYSSGVECNQIEWRERVCVCVATHTRSLDTLDASQLRQSGMLQDCRPATPPAPTRIGLLTHRLREPKSRRFHARIRIFHTARARSRCLFQPPIRVAVVKPPRLRRNV